MTPGEALRRARKLAGLSQAELAKRLGTTQSAVARAEGDAVEPSISYMRRVATATGQRITLNVMPVAPLSRRESRRRWEAVDGGAFNPWERSPEPAEIRHLRRAGRTDG